MAINRLPSGKERKEVISRTRRKPSSQISRSKPVAGKIRNALLLAGGLQALGGGASVLPGCSAENGGNENIGRTSQALAQPMNPPTTPSLGLSGTSKIAYVERSGSNITLYVVNNPGSNPDILKVGTVDGGLNWNSPNPTPVGGANSPQIETDFKVCGGKAYVVSAKDGISEKLYEGTWSGGVVGPLSLVPGALNDDFSGINAIACDGAGTKMFATSNVASANYRIRTADIGVWTWSELTSCSDTVKNTYGMFVDANDFYVGSDRTGTVGGYDLMVYNGGWNGTNCSGGVTNLNAIVGSATVNDANHQGSLFLDNTGDLWYADNGTIKWATKKTGGGDGGAGGTGGDSGTGGDAGTGGVDAGTGGDAGVGGDAGAPPDGGGGTGGDSGTGGTGTGGDSGTGGTGGDSGTGGTGGDSGTGGTGTGGDSGTGGSGGDSGTGGTGGDSGTGGTGPVAECDIVNVTQTPTNFQIDNCTATTLSAHINGPTTFRIGNTTYTVEGVVPNAPNNFNYEAPKFPSIGDGVELVQDETETDPAKKIVDYQYGDITGYEGTKVRKWVPSELNPNKSSGEIRIVATTTLEGLQRKYIADGCDKTQLTTCTPNEQYGNGGEIPAGVTKYKELSTGEVSENPADFDVIPPVQNKSENDGGCSVSGHVGSTRNDLALLFAGLGIAAVMRRRKQD